MDREFKYMVATRCFTFNHASYIEDAMNGFTMQETDFPVVTLIVDDASKDGEPEIIRNYLADNFQTPFHTEDTHDYYLICADHLHNNNCTFIVFLLKYNHHSINKPKMPYLFEWLDNAKYHAICEGDDYWITPVKLQSQVDFLETHPDYGMIHTHVLIRTESTLEPAKDYGPSDFDSLLIGNKVHTLSVCYRCELLSLFHAEINPGTKNWGMGDYPFWLYISSRCKIYYSELTMGVYRVLKDSASHFSKPDFDRELKYKTSIFDVQLFFAELKGRDHLISRIKLQRAHTSLMIKCKYGREDIVEERKTILNAGAYLPRDYFARFLLLLYPSLISFKLLRSVLLVKHSLSNKFNIR